MFMQATVWLPVHWNNALLLMLQILQGFILIEMYKERLNVYHFFKDSKVMQSIDVYPWC